MDKQDVKVTAKAYLRDDVPPIRELPWLGFQMMLTMFTATVLVAILTKFDVGTTLLTSGLGTVVALFVTKRRIPMYYGSSFSYIAVVIAVMSKFAPACFASPAQVYCPEGVRIVQVGILGTAIVEVLIGLLVMRVGKAALDKVLPPIVTGSVALVIGVALAGAALNNAGGASIGIAPDQAWKFWIVSLSTLVATILFSVFFRKGLIGMLPILLGAVFGYLISIPFGLVDFSQVASAAWLRVPSVTFPAFADPRSWGVVLSIALIALATVPEATAHLYQISLYLDELAQEVHREGFSIKKLIGLNLVADGSSDLIAGIFGGPAGTSYGECNSLMAITRNYSTAVLFVAGGIAIALAFVGKLGALVNTMPVAVQGGLGIYLFGIIGMQGIALLMSEKVDMFNPKNLGIGAAIIITGIGGNLALPNGTYPISIPVLFPNGIPAIVFAAIVGILLNVITMLKKDQPSQVIKN
jgi:uracil permease